MAPGFKVAQELGPVGFSFADENYIRVRLRFIRHQSDMGSAQNHRNCRCRNRSAMA